VAGPGFKITFAWLSSRISITRIHGRGKLTRQYTPRNQKTQLPATTMSTKKKSRKIGAEAGPRAKKKKTKKSRNENTKKTCNPNPVPATRRDKDRKPIKAIPKGPGPGLPRSREGLHPAFAQQIRERPKSEAEHLNPSILLLVAVVSVGRQATGRPGASTKATGECQGCAEHRRKRCWRSARSKKSCLRRTTSRPFGLYRKQKKKAKKNQEMHFTRIYRKKKLIAEERVRARCGRETRRPNLKIAARARRKTKTAHVVLNMAYGGTHPGGRYARCSVLAHRKRYCPGNTRSKVELGREARGTRGGAAKKIKLHAILG